MRKHFLILMLLALLPFTAGAQAYDLSADGWVIQFYSTDDTPELITSSVYKNAPNEPTVKLYNPSYLGGAPVTLESEKFNVTWSSSPVKDVVVGGYTVTVTPDWTSTVGEATTQLTGKFYITKATAIVDPEPARNTALDLHYDGSPINLLANPNAVATTFGTVVYSINDGEWSDQIPTAKMPGSYVVKWKVEGTQNYNGHAVVTLDPVNIAGTTIPSSKYTVPEALTTAEKENLTFKWGTTDGVAQELIHGGHMNEANVGIMKYRFKKSTEGDEAYSDWNTDVPAVADAATYNVQWMIEGTNGYADKTAASFDPVTIKKKTPTVELPTGKTGLIYGGDNSAEVVLLAGDGSASDGATPKYKMRSKTTGDWTEWSATSLAFDQVKGKAAGTYEIKTVVDAEGNYNAATTEGVATVTIGKATAYTAVPTAKTLTWSNADQVLVNPAKLGNVDADKVLYSINYNPNGAAGNGTWKSVTDADFATTIKGKNATDYKVYWKVTDANYVAKAETKIDVTIARKVVSVKVNDISKYYDNSLGLTTTTIDNSTDRFTFMGLIDGTASTFNAYRTATDKYEALTDNKYKAAGTYADIITTDPDVATTGLNAISTGAGYFYDFNIIPGKLTVKKMPLTITAKQPLETTFGVAMDIRHEYTIKDVNNGDVAATTAFTVVPVLNSTATGAAPEPGDYELSFTEGTLKSNFELSENGYVIPENAIFKVKPDPLRKVVITVLPQTQKYTGVAESWADPQEGTHYVVSGLVPGDYLKTKPTLTRSEADKFDVKEYTLTPSNAALRDETAAKYPGGIVYNASTFTITPVELTATVNQQTIFEGETVDNIDQDAWTVTGLVGPDATTGKSVLGGTLAFNTTVGTADEKANPAAAKLYTKGIKLNITNGNYTLKGATKDDADNKYYVYAPLRVITAKTLELDPTAADLADRISDAADDCATSREDNVGDVDTNSDDVFYTVTFAHKTLKADTWYTMVLPFAVKATELVNSVLDAPAPAGKPVFTITNRLSSASTIGNLVFKLEMKEIPANEPFLIKTAEDVDLQNFSLAKRIIIDATPESPAYDGNKMIGTYENIKIQCATGNVLKWLVNEETEKPAAPGTYYDVNNWKVCRDYEAPINALEAYLFENRTVDANAARPTIITVEDFDGETTAIKTLNAETMKAYNAEGWYTIDGMKLQSAPTEKGVYINNGKKVVVK